MDKYKIRKLIFKFFEKYPNPSDTLIHRLAEKIGMDESELENEIYSFLSCFINAGYYYDRTEELKVDPQQLERGIEVEMEHTNCPIISRRIALDHLTEISDYYTRLDKMEKEAEKEINQAEVVESDNLKKEDCGCLKKVKF